MKTYEQVKAGLTRYLDMELMPRLSGIKKWMVGAGLSMYLEKGVDIFNSLKASDFVRTLEVIDCNDCIDIEKLYLYIHREAEKSAITFKTQMLGDITLTAGDVERLYSYIMAE